MLILSVKLFVVLLLDRALGPKWVCLGPVCSVRVLDFVQRRFYNTSPGDCEGMFIKAGERETKKGLA